jgi:hypothetical protein
MSHRPDSECGAAGHWLMCPKVGSLSPTLKDTSSECAEARQWATKYRDAYLSGGG